jgi:hypothetical protein
MSSEPDYSDITKYPLPKGYKLAICPLSNTAYYVPNDRELDDGPGNGQMCAKMYWAYCDKYPKCPDCNGEGEYVNFTHIHKCQTCRGNGRNWRGV